MNFILITNNTNTNNTTAATDDTDMKTNIENSKTETIVIIRTTNNKDQY